MARPTLLLFVASLRTPGGAERVLTRLANQWSRSGFDVVLATFDPEGTESFFRLHAEVRLAYLDLLSNSSGVPTAIRSNLRRIRIIRRSIVRTSPAAVISFGETTNVIVLISAIGLKVPVVISERTTPGHLPLGRVWSHLRSVFYRRAAAIVVLSRTAASFFTGAEASRVSIIGNPVIRPERHPPVLIGTRRIVAVGRMTEEKGLDVLIEAFAIAGRSHPDWTLVIHGDGPLRGQLEALVDRLELRGRVFMPGVSKDVGSEIANADLFVLSSSVEGFPNALCEAMALGRPVIATRCPGAVSDLIRPDIDGVLVPVGDPDALARAMTQLIADPARREQLGERAREIVEPFSTERIADEWKRILSEAGVMVP